MAVATYTKSGAKAAAPATLDKAVFAVEVKNHQLLKDAYLSHLASSRANLAVTKKRGEVRGGGRKPWRQKGTGRARVGSSRNPLWTGGGVAFGPTGNENYTRKLSTKARRQALRQALTLAAQEDRIKIVEAFEPTGRVKSTIELLKKLGANGKTLIIVGQQADSAERSTRNISDVRLVLAAKLNVYDVMNCDCMVISKDSLKLLADRLGADNE